MKADRDNVMDFVFVCHSTIIIKKLKALIDWGVLKQLFEKPSYISCGFNIFCANLAVGICDSVSEAKDLIRLGSSF